MTPLARRRCIGMQQKLTALAAEFLQWRRITRPGAALEKHHTQVRALTAHLSGLRLETRAIFRESRGAGVLEEARNVEALVLGIRRIWEFFRSKLMQRLDPEQLPFLQLADELAWACYRPVLNAAGPAARREPPLVFLNGGLSPYAVSRDEAFAAESVAGEALSGRTWDPVLRRIPIPVIGVPWYQTAHLPDLPVVAHETGHTVERDFVPGQVGERIERQLKATPGEARSAHWTAWSGEIFADLWGCLTLGPAFAGALMEFLAIAPAIVKNEVATVQGKYPTAGLRIALCLHALRELLGFEKEAESLKAEWRSHFDSAAMPAFEADVGGVCAAILDTEYSIGGKNVRFLKMPGLAFTANEWRYAKQAAPKIIKAQALDAATPALRLVAAARFSFDENPSAYAVGKYGERFKKYIGVVVHPGVRAGEPRRTGVEIAKSETADEAAGREWFQDFKQWAGVANPSVAPR